MAIPIVVLLGDDIKSEMKENSGGLLEGIGSSTVLNYEEGLPEGAT
jgi:hypothetical protein